MKKFISMVMAAAMVVSLVPATAFAAGDVKATAKVVDDVEMTEDETKAGAKYANGYISWNGAPEVQIKVTDVDYQKSEAPDAEMEVTITLDGAEFKKADETLLTAWDLLGLIEIESDEDGVTDFDGSGSKRPAATAGDVKMVGTSYTVEVLADDVDKDEFTFTIYGELHEDDIISVDLESLLTKTKENHKAFVSVESDMVTTDDMVYAAILGQALVASVKDTVDVAVEEVVALDSKGLTIEAAVGNLPAKLTLKTSKGFEFVKSACNAINGITWVDDNELEVATASVDKAAADKIVIKGIEIEATTAKEGAVCVIKASANDFDSASVEVATVCDYKVVMSVDEDDDVPVMWSGVDAANRGLTVDDTHEALEVTIKETFPGAWSMHKDFTLSLPEGVYVTAVKVDDENVTLGGNGNLYDEFVAAYQEGDHTSFVFEKRTFDETAPDHANVDMQEEHEMTFVLELVAEPTFVGDVVLTLEGDTVDTQEVTIAKFVAPMTVKAEQNDLKIDYRYTEVGTDIVVTEAEAGLWDENLVIGFAVEKGDYIKFEDDAVFTVNEESDMEIEDKTDVDRGELQFTVEETSDEEAAVVTISGIELFMQRNIPAGPYDLDLFYYSTDSDYVAFDGLKLFAADCWTADVEKCECKYADKVDYECAVKDHECFIGDVADYSTTVKEGWINVVTAGREADDASFTTKVVVPVGEAYIIAGETQVALDVPAYVNAAGYTMLPVRAVAVALGINTQNVLWDQATKTVTILYGQRIITMQVGAKVVYVNGSAIPASASVEIVDGRTFLPMRDLATALGVTDITWDAATKTATLNGNA